MLQTGNCQLTNQSFPNDAFKSAEFWCTVGLAAVLYLLQRKDSTFFIYSFYCCFVKAVKPTRLGGNNIEGKGDILLNFLWLLIFYLHKLK